MQLLFLSRNYTYLFQMNHSEVVLLLLHLLARHVKSICLDTLRIKETTFPFKYVMRSSIDGSGVKPEQFRIKFLHQPSPSAVLDG